MIFSELYSVYYNTVAKILSSAVRQTLNNKEMQRLAAENAFSESALTIVPSLRDGRWQLVTKDCHTPVCHEPTMPMTTLQKRWLKAISLDPRIHLFDICFDGLDDVEPLFTPEDYIVFDKYADGDKYSDEDYIRRFKLILDAVRNKYPLIIGIINRKGYKITMNVMPEYLEYSEKDDKFRLISSGYSDTTTINLGRITSCERYCKDIIKKAESRQNSKKHLKLELTDERNALERLMLHFAHFEKQTEKTGNDRYSVTIRYNEDDESEMVIRVLSFGPFVKVVEPDSFVELIRNRLIKQKSCGL